MKGPNWTPECVEQVRAWLIEVAKRGETTTFKETAAHAPVCGAKWPRYAALYHNLYKVSAGEHKEGRPLLTAVLIRADGGVPAGFCGMARGVGKLTGADCLAFWCEEIKRVHEFWRP